LANRERTPLRSAREMSVSMASPST